MNEKKVLSRVMIRDEPVGENCHISVQYYQTIVIWTLYFVLSIRTFIKIGLTSLGEPCVAD